MNGVVNEHLLQFAKELEVRQGGLEVEESCESVKAKSVGLKTKKRKRASETHSKYANFCKRIMEDERKRWDRKVETASCFSEQESKTERMKDWILACKRKGRERMKCSNYFVSCIHDLK